MVQKMSHNNKSNDTTTQYFIGLDVLRALMILFVVAHHTQLFVNNHLLFNSIKLTELITYNLLYFGVPGFFLISIFLFSIKAKKNKHYFLDRLETLVYSYIFWSVLWILIDYSKGFYIFKWLITLSLKDFFYFMAGSGIGIFYFHFSLILLTCISFLIINVSRYILWLLLSLSVALFLIIPLTNLAHDPFFSSYWSPFNFLPYAFIGNLLSNIYQEKSMAVLPITTIAILAILFTFSATAEWHFSIHTNHGLMAYMRVSVVLGISIIFLLSLYIKKHIKIAQYLSDNALGIYCLQLFVTNAYLTLAGTAPKGDIVYSTSVLFVCLLGSIFLRKAFSKGVI